MPLDEYRVANRENWNDRVPIHWDSDDYNIQQFIDDPECISDVVQFDLDREELGDVTGKSLLHLQCHIGNDTLSWARLGADVTGVDFSEAAILACNRLSADSGTPGEFVVADLYESPNVLPDRVFDIVYTGIGSICWLQDINGWAKVVAHFLKPGGTFYILEIHPMVGSLSVDDHNGQLVLDWPYFESAGPQGYDERQSYTGTGEVAHTRQYNTPHGLGETIDALIQAGLILDFVHEHQLAPNKILPMHQPAGKGFWKMPDGRENDLPLMHSIKAHKPE